MPGMMDTVLNVSTKDFPKVMEHVEQVFKSWMSPRALAYRKINGIPDDIGTACVIQQMVSGKGEGNGTGVVFSRNPNTGEDELYGEFLPDALGEELVGGTKQPMAIEEWLLDTGGDFKTALGSACTVLETAEKDMQEIEFTINGGTCYFLQTRRAGRNPDIARKVIDDLYAEKVIDSTERQQRIAALPPEAQAVKKEIKTKPFLEGIGACGGLVSGVVAYTDEQAIDFRKKYGRVILVKRETTPLDIVGFEASVGVLTQIGGVTSHAAVNGRTMGLSVVVGAVKLKPFSAAGGSFAAGAWITIDGASGRVWKGDLLKGKEKKAA